MTVCFTWPTCFMMIRSFFVSFALLSVYALTEVNFLSKKNQLELQRKNITFLNKKTLQFLINYIDRPEIHLRLGGKLQFHLQAPILQWVFEKNKYLNCICLTTLRYVIREYLYIYSSFQKDIDTRCALTCYDFCSDGECVLVYCDYVCPDQK